MDRLNYFFPYQFKDENHEDQLTRAFLVILKHSPVVANVFYDICKKVFDDTNRDALQQLPHLSNLVSEQWTFNTQKSNPVIETRLLLSVLITDQSLQNNNNLVRRSERSARYDGILTIGQELTVIIENKPNSINVWFDQLSPASEHLSPETEVLKNHVLIQWKDIVSMLTGLIKKGTTNSLLIEDFLSYIDSCYPTLNPYDKFGLCKGNQVLLQRRVKNILEKISVDASIVQYHKGWAYKIELGLPQIKMIGLALVIKEKNWWLELSLYAGNTVNQSRALYRSLNDLKSLDVEGMYPKADFHCSFMTSNLIWFDSPNVHKYIAYWRQHQNEIRQYPSKEIYGYLEELNNEGIIIYEAAEEQRLDDVIYSANINMCPGIGLIYEIESIDAIDLDDKGLLEQLIADKIHLGLNVLGTKTSLIK